MRIENLAHVGRFQVTCSGLQSIFPFPSIPAHVSFTMAFPTCEKPNPKNFIDLLLNCSREYENTSHRNISVADIFVKVQRIFLFHKVNRSQPLKDLRQTRPSGKSRSNRAEMNENFTSTLVGKFKLFSCWPRRVVHGYALCHRPVIQEFGKWVKLVWRRRLLIFSIMRQQSFHDHASFSVQLTAHYASVMM